MRKTKIVCTIGPSSSSESVLKELMKAGMNVARLNMSHGSEAEHKKVFDRIVEVREQLNVPVGMMVDLKGPEIRVGKFENDGVVLKKGQQFILEAGTKLGNNQFASVNSKLLAKYVLPKQKLLLSDGEIELVVQSIADEKVFCKVEFGGFLGNNKSINAPGAHIPLEFLSASDKKDILFAIRESADFLALSFVESKDNVLQVRKFLEKNGGEDIKIISKIESACGVENMEEIVAASDGIMVARGDLGVEVDFEELPHIQKQMIALSRKYKKPVITATQMLESMIENARPTRAEVTDIANAVLDGSDAVMLSGETAIGKHPVKCVKTMSDIAESSEKHIDYVVDFKEKLSSDMKINECVAYAAVASSFAVSAKKILATTISGKTALELSACRPKASIVACTPSKKALHQMSIMFGVFPVLFKKAKTIDKILAESVNAAEKAKLLQKGETVVQTTATSVGAQTNTMRVFVAN